VSIFKTGATQRIDYLEDMIDLFWEQPFAVATFVQCRYPAELADVFAGGVIRPSAAIIGHSDVPQIAQTDETL
jgi:hypothetical protein